MLPGKTYKPEEFLQILRKRLWVIVVPWAIVAAATAVVVKMLPDRYRAQARIQIVAAKVPESIMKPPTTASLQERLNATREVILSRTRLERMVKEFNLYPEKQKTDIMEDIVTDMRRDINTAPTKGDTFLVQYVGSDPVTVLKVTERLAQHFMDESLKEGVRRAEGTSAFVEGQVDDKERQLKDIEDRMTAYKMRHGTELPAQVGANQNAINGINNQLSNLALAQTQDINRRQFVEAKISELETQATVPASVTTVPTTDPSGPIGPAAKDLAQKQDVLNKMIASGMKPTHHLYIAADKAVKDATKAAAAEALRMPVSAATAGLSPAEANRVKQLETYRAELKTLNEQIAGRETADKALRAKAMEYQARIDAAPLHEAALTALNREYGVISGLYNSYLNKREAATSAVDLERRQIGEQFNLLDAAQLPQRPISPDRLTYNLMGLVAGLAIGLALVVLLEYRDTTFKTDSELSGVLNLPVLAVVPLMQSDTERRSRFRRRLILNLGFGGTAALCFALVAYTFVTMR